MRRLHNNLKLVFHPQANIFDLTWSLDLNLQLLDEWSYYKFVHKDLFEKQTAATGRSGLGAGRGCFAQGHSDGDALTGRLTLQHLIHLLDLT